MRAMPRFEISTIQVVKIVFKRSPMIRLTRPMCSGQSQDTGAKSRTRQGQRTHERRAPVVSRHRGRNLQRQALHEVWKLVLSDYR